MNAQTREKQHLCMNTHDEYEKFAVMISSGASETTYLSAARKQAEDIVNVGQRYMRVVDDHGTESWAKFQMCKGLGQHKILGSVSSGIWTLGGV